MYNVLATKETTYRTEAPMDVFPVENKPAAKRLIAKLRKERVYFQRKYRRFATVPIVFVQV